MKKFFLLFGLSIVLAFSFQKSFSQEDPNAFLPQATGGSDTVLDDTNIYLQQEPVQTEQVVEKTPAQTVNKNLSGVYEGTKLACPYAFERDLQIGSKGEDVRLLQVLLNSDKRTMIAINGAGSLGKETNSFGEATKIAVKKFQALFIEYVGVANGRFGPRTRTVMNAICTGDTTSKDTASGNKKETTYDTVQSVQKDATPQGEVTEVPNDKIAPRVSLSANLNTVSVGDNFKVVANFSEEVKPITPDSIIVDGGVVKEIRKLSKTSYSITITPNEGAKSIFVQVEADKIQDLAGNTNENASNEVTVKVKVAVLTTATNQATSSDISSLVNNVISSAPNCNYDNQGNLININPATGAQVNTTGCQPTKTAAYNSQIGCYADNGPLPNGISETQRCSNPQNPNNPNSPCSAQNQSLYRQQLMNYQQQIQQQQSYYGYYNYGYVSQPPTNPCTNSNIAAATQNSAQQGLYNQAQAQQQAAQNSSLGNLLGSLLGKNFMGNNSKNDGGNSNGGGGGNGGQGGPQTSDQTKKQQIQNDLQALTDQYSKECNTSEKLATQNCKDIEKKASELTNEFAKGENTENCPPGSKGCSNMPYPENCPPGSQDCANMTNPNSQTQKDPLSKEQCNINGAMQSGQACIDQDSKGKVSATHEEIKKQCGYLAEKSGVSAKILESQGSSYTNYSLVKITNGNKTFLILQKQKTLLSKIVAGQDFLRNTTNTKKVEYKCCENNNFWEKAGWQTSTCKSPGPLNDLNIYELDKGIDNLGQAGFSSKQ